VPTIELLRVDAVELAHAARQGGLNRLDQKMVVVRHLAVGMTAPVESLSDLREDIEEQLAIWVDEEDLLARVAAACDVVQSTGVLNA